MKARDENSDWGIGGQLQQKLRALLGADENSDWGIGGQLQPC